MNNFSACVIGGTATFLLLGTREDRSIARGGLALTYAVLVPYYFAFLSEFAVQVLA